MNLHPPISEISVVTRRLTMSAVLYDSHIPFKTAGCANLCSDIIWVYSALFPSVSNIASTAQLRISCTEAVLARWKVISYLFLKKREESAWRGKLGVLDRSSAQTKPARWLTLILNVRCVPLLKMESAQVPDLHLSKITVP